MAVPFDAGRLAISGAAVPIVEGVLQSALSGSAQYTLSASGTLVYVPSTRQAADRVLVFVDRDGTEHAVAAPSRLYRNPKLSPDGKQLAMAIEEPELHIWVYDLTRETLTRFTQQSASNPTWSRDGTRIAFASTGVKAQLVDGSGRQEELSAPGAESPHSWSSDGQLLALSSPAPNTGWNISVRSADGQVRPFQRTSFNEGAPAFSPSGRWLAYSSDESGRYEIYVQEYPGPGRKFQISTEGGTEPVWNPRGNELCYRNGDRMMALPVTLQPTFSAGKPTLLFRGPYQSSATLTANYDVGADGRFLMLKPAALDNAPTQLNVVLNWVEELRRKAPAK